ncbi:hypothetical protein [Nereida ignava]|uniref:hypothetical protein n=1 Tax=Nereida ignava TaxID=282199 RepID=UPI0030F55394
MLAQKQATQEPLPAKAPRRKKPRKKQKENASRQAFFFEKPGYTEPALPAPLENVGNTDPRMATSGSRKNSPRQWKQRAADATARLPGVTVEFAGRFNGRCHPMYTVRCSGGSFQVPGSATPSDHREFEAFVGEIRVKARAAGGA